MPNIIIDIFHIFMTPHPDKVGHGVNHRTLFYDKCYNSGEAQKKCQLVW